MKITEERIRFFAEVTGDFNPLHMDEMFAKKSRFGKRIAHGMLVASTISAKIAEEYPGAIYAAQDLIFLEPVFIGDEIHAVLTKLDERTVRTEAMRGDEVVITGEAVVLWK